MANRVEISGSTALLMRNLELFIDARCEKRQNNAINIAVLYDAFEVWCMERDLWPGTKKHVGVALSKMGYTKHKRNNVTYYLGIDFRDDD